MNIPAEVGVVIMVAITVALAAIISMFVFQTQGILGFIVPLLIVATAAMSIAVYLFTRRG